MFGTNSACILYGAMLVSLLLWSCFSVRLLWQLKRFQHEEWHARAAWLFFGYCILEFLRIMDSAFTDSETGIIYSIWGVVPWWLRNYSWALRDIIMYRGICIYLEHAVVWTHSCLGGSVPRKLIWMLKVSCYFGNGVFIVSVTKFMAENDQFWTPCVAMGQVPPNIAVAIVCYYLYRKLQNVPDCEESRHAIIVNMALLVAAFSVVCVFTPWAVPRMQDLWTRQLSVHPGIPSGSSILFSTAPSFFGAGDRQLDLSLELVEFTVGWCGFLGLNCRSLCAPVAGEPVVYSSEEVGQLVARNAKKLS